MTNFHKVRLAVQTLLRLLTKTAARIAKECNKNTRQETTRVYKSSAHCAQSPGCTGWSQPRRDRGPARQMAQPCPHRGPRGQAGHSLAWTRGPCGRLVTALPGPGPTQQMAGPLGSASTLRLGLPAAARPTAQLGSRQDASESGTGEASKS